MSTFSVYLTAFGVFGVISLVTLIISLRLFSRVYSEKFDTLTKTIKELIMERDARIQEAFDERDARFGRLQGVLSQTIIRDTALFDSMVEDTESFPLETEDGVDEYTPDDTE